MRNDNGQRHGRSGGVKKMGLEKRERGPIYIAGATAGRARRRRDNDTDNASSSTGERPGIARVRDDSF